jgi:hypothetical protein
MTRAEEIRKALRRTEMSIEGLAEISKAEEDAEYARWYVERTDALYQQQALLFIARALEDVAEASTGAVFGDGIATRTVQW